jgi:flagellar hook assembly protein FlgD
VCSSDLATEDLKVNIYNTAGELVRTMHPGPLQGGFTHYLPWDCANGSGRTVSSGIYFGEVVWGGKRKVFKMAIIKGSGL